MERHFDQELAQVKEQLLMMAGLVEENFARAIRSLTERDSSLVDTVEKEDDQIDELEMQIDEACIKLIALRAPLASDLRLITVAMKISTDLERIADQSVNIARAARELNKEPMLKPLIDIPRMAAMARAMMRDAIEAFIHKNPALARSIPARDKEVDDINRQLYRELTSFMLEAPHNITRALRLMFISKFIERIADHACNIAEEVVYLFEAKDIRHGADLKEPGGKETRVGQ